MFKFDLKSGAALWVLAGGAAAAVAAGAAVAVAAQSNPIPSLTAPFNVRIPHANYNFEDNAGWTAMFDGRSLAGWVGDTTVWGVKDGALYAENTCEHPTGGTVYLDYVTAKKVGDFELKLKTKIVSPPNGNGGIQYHGWIHGTPNKPYLTPTPAAPRPATPAPAAAAAPAAAPAAPRPPACANPGTPPVAGSSDKYWMDGPQYDYNATGTYAGQWYEQKSGRGIVASPGQVMIAGPGQVPQVLSVIADGPTVQSWWKKDDWNDVLIVVRGHVSSHYVNGHLSTMLIDNDPAYWQPNGEFAIEIEGGMPTQIWVKDMYLRKYS